MEKTFWINANACLKGHKPKNLVIFLLLLLLVPVRAISNDDCEEVLENGPGQVSIVSSGRDLDLLPHYIKDFPLLAKVSHFLGITVPPHRVEMVPSGQLTALASNGHYPIPHWIDGAMISHAAKTAGSVLEFVHPGCPTCRSFYQDTSHLEQQRSIYIHVLGHNDFSKHSVFFKVRGDMDPMAESLRFAELVNRLYETVDHDEVSLWYQFLMSLVYAQDFGRGSYDAPEFFKNDPDAQRVIHEVERDLFGQIIESPQSAYGKGIWPKRPSQSILQAATENLPSTVPRWKKEMAFAMERMSKAYGAFVQTKFMNEGWATFMEWFLVPYTPWRTSRDLVAYGQMGFPPNLKDPYWLGEQAWQRVYARFKEKVENESPELLKHLSNPKDVEEKISRFLKSLTEEEKAGLKFPDPKQVAIDMAFIEFAHLMMKTDGDYDFLLRALDEKWVNRWKLHLRREVTVDEYDWQLPDRKPDEDTQYIIISRDTKRVIQKVAQNAVDRELQFPTITLENLNGLGRNVFQLKHHVYHDIPLRFKSMIQTLYVYARIFEKPVSIETIASSSWVQKQLSPYRYMIDPFAERPVMLPMRVEVTPGGEVMVDFGKGEGKIWEALNREMPERAKKYLASFMLDIEGSTNLIFAKREAERLGQLQAFLPKIVDVNLDPSMGMLHHGPFVADALLEYAKMVEERLEKALNAALKGKLGVKYVGQSVRIKVLPDVPEFELDRRVKKLLKETENPDPLDQKFAQRIVGDPLKRDLGTFSDVGSGDGDVGDKNWGKKPKEEEGKGDGDEQGDPSEGEEEGRQPGDGHLDPTEIEIPIEIWQELLAEQFELPNMRELDGKSTVTRTIKLGTKRHPVGDIAWHKTMKRALIYALGEKLKKGEPLKIDNLAKMLVEGGKYITPADYVVRAKHVETLPDTKAVMVFVADASGSMMGEPQVISRELVKNLKLIVEHSYDQVEFRFILFDTQAIEVSEEGFSRKTLGGGTAYHSGFKMAEEVLEAYPQAEWDQYVVGVGDCEASDTQETVASLQQLMETTRYIAFFHIDPRGYFGDGIGGSYWGDFIRGLKGLGEVDEGKWFGFTTVTGKGPETLEALRKLFGKNKTK